MARTQTTTASTKIPTCEVFDSISRYGWFAGVCYVNALFRGKVQREAREAVVRDEGGNPADNDETMDKKLLI